MILLVAYIFQIIAFFSIKEDSAVAQYGQPVQTTGYCPNCGAQVEPGAKFCRNCGKSLEVLEQTGRLRKGKTS